MAMGGSSNTVLHTLAIAHEAGGIAYDLDRINAISQKCPNVCKVAPSCSYHMEDVDAAGGISAILKRIADIPGLLDKSCPTVSGKTIGEIIATSSIKNDQVIRTIDNAYSKDGGPTILRGNLAAEGAAAVKKAGGGPLHAHIRRGGHLFRLTGRGVRRHPCGQGQSRPRGGHPLRRTGAGGPGI